MRRNGFIVDNLDAEGVDGSEDPERSAEDYDYDVARFGPDKFQNVTSEFCQRPWIFKFGLSLHR